MNEERVGSVLVTDGPHAVGILTLPDLPGRVLLPRVPLDSAVDGVMSGKLFSLGADHSGEDAARAMARHGVRHIVVNDHDGHLLGVIAQSDLYARLRSDIHALGNRIRTAQDIDALELAARAVRGFCIAMLRDGTAAEALTLHVSSLNDALGGRAIELVLAHHADARVFDEVRWCWLAFGSEGRMEQTFSTDQDNGLVFEPPAGLAAEAVRPALLRVAGAINQALARLGFPLCEGGIMAGQARCCLSLDEWRAAFGNWVAHPQPEALLAASIFFDFRALHGDASLADALRTHLLGLSRAAPLFLRLMAENALRVSPPLGFMRRFLLDDRPGAPHSLDLKAGGARVFIDCARLLALREGVSTSSTSGRLREMAAHPTFASEDVEAQLKAFFFIQQLRLSRQAETSTPAGRNIANRIDPGSLDELDRVMLRHAFGQARRLQNRIRLDWQLP